MDTHLTLRPTTAPEGMDVPKELEGRRLVAFPDRPAKPLAPEGERVRMSTYWARRLACEDVETVAAPAKPTRKPTRTEE